VFHFRGSGNNAYFWGMKKGIVVLVMMCLFGNAICFSQNLVPNSSFETITSCSTIIVTGFAGGIVSFWDSPTNGTPDVFNTCSTASQALVPLNNFGYQNSHSGNGYAGAGFYGFDIDYYIEYIQVKLDTDLIAGKTYCAGFYISLANKSIFAIKNFGMYFSNTHVYQAITANLGFTPQIVDTNYVTDTLNWVHFEGSFTAMGGERYLIIGNFNSDITTDTMTVNPSGHQYTYYYIDDVDVHECPSGQGMVEYSNENDVSLSPNPTSSIITITSTNKIKEVNIYNIVGELIKNYELRITNGSTTIDISTVSKGIYFAEIQTDRGVVRKKIVKE
jgi:hypothetical protein